MSEGPNWSSEGSQPDRSAPRKNVGYGHPPVEHQFKTGQKPPPRKRKPKAEETSRELLERLMKEPRRVLINGKASWWSTGALIIHKAYESAEKGSPTLRRLLSDLHFAGEPTELLPPKESWWIKQEDGSFTPVTNSLSNDADGEDQGKSEDGEGGG